MDLAPVISGQTKERHPRRTPRRPTATTDVKSVTGPSVDTVYEFKPRGLEQSRRILSELSATQGIVLFGSPDTTPAEQTASIRASGNLTADTFLVVSYEKIPTREDKVHAELQSYLSLQTGWDGYEGVVPSLNAIRDAFRFLKKRPDDIPMPYPQLASDGEVGLYWRTDEVHAEVGFYGDGEYSYYARYRPEGQEPIEELQDNCTLEDEEWAERLLRVLNKIAEQE